MAGPGGARPCRLAYTSSRSSRYPRVPLLPHRPQPRRRPGDEQLRRLVPAERVVRRPCPVHQQHQPARRKPVEAAPRQRRQVVRHQEVQHLGQHHEVEPPLRPFPRHRRPAEAHAVQPRARRLGLAQRRLAQIKPEQPVAARRQPPRQLADRAPHLQRRAEPPVGQGGQGRAILVVLVAAGPEPPRVRVGGIQPVEMRDVAGARAAGQGSAAAAHGVVGHGASSAPSRRNTSHTPSK